MFWKEVKQQRKEGGKREEMVKDQDGQMLTGEEEVIRRWAEHFKELLNFNDDQETGVTPVAFEEGALRGMRVGGNGRGRYPSGVCQAGGRGNSRVANWVAEHVLMLERYQPIGGSQ